MAHQTDNTSKSKRAELSPEGDAALSKLLRSGRRHNRVRRIVEIIIVISLLVGAGFVFVRMKLSDNGTVQPAFRTEKATIGNLVSTISATGAVEALNTVEVGAEISGRILFLGADFNDTVTMGQVLARIDPEQHEAAVAQAKAQKLAALAQVAEAEATLLESRQTADRSQELASKGLLSPRELESATARAVRAQASLKSAQASAALAGATYDAARSRLARTEIQSPISGTVLSREVEVGQTINAGMQTPVIFIIAEDLSRMRLSSRVDEADIGNVKHHQKASFTVDAYPDKTFDSEVESVRNVPKTDQNVVSYEVLLSVSNEEMLLKPGMTASVEIVTEKFSDVLLVPNKALRFAPPKESLGFRGPPGGGVPFLRNTSADPTRKKPGADSAVNLGAIKGNQGVIWVIQHNTTSGLRAIKVEKLATDGIHTAISSAEIKAGSEVVVEQTESKSASP